jgi:hypothetical protein
MQITAMPSLCDSTDFGLSVNNYNNKTGLSYLKRNPKIIEKLSDVSNLYRLGNKSEGFMFTWNTELQLIGYFVHYKVKSTKFHGLSVTQTALWRNLLDADSSGLTNKVVFSILLKEYPAILSDKIQTGKGKDFWISLMTKALKLGHKVGLVSFNEQLVHNINSNLELRLWLTDDLSGAWSFNSNQHQALRFIIYS